MEIHTYILTDGSSMVWADKVISIESGFIQLLGRSSYPASSCTVTTKSSVDSETALYSFIAEIRFSHLHLLF